MCNVCHLNQSKTGIDSGLVFRMGDKPDRCLMVGLLDGENGVLMQYTGIKDKNGNEIYEGDVIVIQNDLHESFVEGNPADLWEIVWNQEALTYWLEHHDKYTHKDSEYVSDLIVDGHLDGEVIGNIYENPELLK